VIPARPDTEDMICVAGETIDGHHTTYNPNLWDLPGEDDTTTADNLHAQQICRRCPALTWCAANPIKGTIHGARATPTRRTRKKKRTLPPGQPLTVCPLGLGSRHGYRSGCRCTPCINANTAYNDAHPRTYPRPAREQLPSRQVHDANVENLITGQLRWNQTTRAEREQAVRTLNRRGCNDAEISRRTGLAVRTVLRIRQRLQLPRVCGPGGRQAAA
jgi:hypothetical protein